MRNYYKVNLLFILFCFICQGLYSQTYILGQNGSEIITCGGTILDPGGNGPYANNLNITQTFTSDIPGQCIQLTINSFVTEVNYDSVKIYNGPTATGEPLFEFSGNNLELPMVLTGTAGSGGSITIQFTSDGSVTLEGFSIGLTCVPCPPDPIIYTLGQGASTINGCGGILLDPGGADNYPNNTNIVQTFCSGTGDCVRLTFLEFEMESGIDFVRFYDGNSLTSPLIDIISGLSLPPSIVTSSQSGGCMTLEFSSNFTYDYEGFKAVFDCVPCEPPPTVYILGNGLSTINTCGGILKDPGASGDYPPSLNVIQTFCSDSGNCLRLTFDQIQTQNTIDLIRVYDGASISATLIGEVSGFIEPSPITSSTNSDGCITIQFVSDAFTNYEGFSASISCVPCTPSADVLILGQGEQVINTCNVILQDPGGAGQYGNDLNITQTICSGTNECINLTFTEFNTEASFDRLTVYDGPDNTAEILGTFSGFVLPPSISSTTESSGCMTLVFTTSASTTNYGWEALVSCIPCPEPLEYSTIICEEARPFCADAPGGLTFPAFINNQSEFEDGICCLGSTPNPSWYYMRIQETGPIDILISSGFDVDFICWGPFTEVQWQNGICGFVLDPDQECLPSPQSSVIDCSYSGSAIEYCNIPNAQQGKYYVLMITNFSNQLTNINFDQVGGDGSTDCDLICDLEVQLNVSFCDSLTNTFAIIGEISLNNPPNSGSVSIVNSFGGIQEFDAPFDSSIVFTFNNIASNGAVGEVSINFINENSCYYFEWYDAPESCSPCAVEASNSSPEFTGETVTLNSTYFSNATYAWSGPNGFNSTDQNPVLNNANLSMEGVYTVTVTIDSLNCQSVATTNVQLNSTVSISDQANEFEFNNDFSLIPNPAFDQLLVLFNFSEEVNNIQLIDMNGRFINLKWAELSKTKYHLDLQNLKCGLYEVIIQSPKGVFFNRLVKLD